MRLIVNQAHFDRLKNNDLPIRAFLQKVALDCQADMGNSWSATSPSLAGQPPAVDTGNLKGGTLVVPYGKNGWELRISPPYAPHLEYGTRKMRPRPFVRPALIRSKARIRNADLVKLLE